MLSTSFKIKIPRRKQGWVCEKICNQRIADQSFYVRWVSDVLASINENMKIKSPPAPFIEGGD